jgi:hypothetical protein
MGVTVPIQQNGPRWPNAESLTLLVRQKVNGADNFATSCPIPVAKRQVTSINVIALLGIDATDIPVDFVIWNGDGQGNPLAYPPKRGYRLTDAAGVQYEIQRMTQPNPYTFRVTALTDR